MSGNILGRIHQHSDSVADICHNLFNKTPISYFDYCHIYDDGRVLLYTTKPDLACKVAEYLPSRTEFEFSHHINNRINIMSHALGLPFGAADLRPEHYTANIEICAEGKLFHRIYFLDRCEGYFRLVGYGVWCK